MSCFFTLVLYCYIDLLLLLYAYVIICSKNELDPVLKGCHVFQAIHKSDSCFQPIKFPQRGPESGNCVFFNGYMAYGQKHLQSTKILKDFQPGFDSHP